MPLAESLTIPSDTDLPPQTPLAAAKPGTLCLFGEGQMNTAMPVIKRGRKYDQVLQGAWTIFMRDGFEGASVDDIARAAGVSKATLYSYFPDKRLLFLEVAKTECSRQTDDALDQPACDQGAERMLTLAATCMVDMFLSDFSMRVFRICVAESDRFPELGREFYKSGPALGRARIVAYLHRAEARGEVRVEDKELAADQFVELCKADIFPRRFFGVSDRISAADRTRVIRGAVEMFLARYGVKG